MNAPALRQMKNHNGWLLRYCRKCGRIKYVETFRDEGSAATCLCQRGLVEHKDVPREYQDGNVYRGPARIPEWQR